MVVGIFKRSSQTRMEEEKLLFSCRIELMVKKTNKLKPKLIDQIVIPIQTSTKFSEIHAFVLARVNSTLGNHTAWLPDGSVWSKDPPLVFNRLLTGTEEFLSIIRGNEDFEFFKSALDLSPPLPYPGNIFC